MDRVPAAPSAEGQSQRVLLIGPRPLEHVCPGDQVSFTSGGAFLSSTCPDYAVSILGA